MNYDFTFSVMLSKMVLSILQDIYIKNKILTQTVIKSMHRIQCNVVLLAY